MQHQKITCQHCENHQREVQMCDCDFENGEFIREHCEENVTGHIALECPKCHNYNGQNYRFCRKIAQAFEREIT